MDKVSKKNRINPCLKTLKLPFIPKTLKKELTWLNQRNKVQQGLRDRMSGD